MNKKLITYSIVCFCLIILVCRSSAIVRTEEVDEWTKDSLGTYFNKYQVLYNRKSDKQSLIDIAKSYKDAATENARIFGSGVDSIISGFTNSIDKHAGLARNDFDGFITDLRHKLRQLELKGQLSRDRIQEVLDHAHKEAVHQKIMTEAEWKKAYTSFTSKYEEPTWYQRVLRLKPEVDEGASSLNNWIHSVTDRVNKLGGITADQTKAIADQLRTNIANSDIHNLGGKQWVEDFTSAVSEKTELTKDELKKVVDSINKDVNGYKVFALDYTGQAKDHAKNWCEQTKSYFENIYEDILEFFKHWYHVVCDKLHIHHHNPTRVSPHRVTENIKSAAHSVKSEWESKSRSAVRSRSVESAKSRVSDAASHVTSKINDMSLEHLKKIDLKNSFGHFWRQKEHDAYRKLGYTEAHIDWIQDYLTRTFRDQKTTVRYKTDEAAIALKRYLNAIHVQSPSQVDSSIHKLKRHLESWRTLIN